MKESADLFKILSVDKRIEIIELLKKEPMNVNSLADNLGVTQSAVSQHLRVLKAAGLVKDERRGYWIHYSLKAMIRSNQYIRFHYKEKEHHW